VYLFLISLTILLHTVKSYILMGWRFHGFPKDHNSSFTQISEIKSIYTRTILEVYIGGHLFLLSSWPTENSGRQSRGFL